MILENAKPKLDEAIEKANLLKESQEIKFIYNELLTGDTIHSVFDYLFRNSINFATRNEEYRFVIIVTPQDN